MSAARGNGEVVKRQADCSANSNKMTTTKLRGYLQVKHNPSNRRSRLPRKVKMSDPILKFRFGVFIGPILGIFLHTLFLSE